MKEVVVVDGLRSPYVKFDTDFKEISAQQLGALVMRELLERLNLNPAELDEVIVGNVAQPPEAANIARIIALYAGVPENVPGFSVQRNCASGMQAVADAWYRIQAGHGSTYMTGGVESMSQIPLLWNKPAADWMSQLFRAKSIGQKLKLFSQLKGSFLKPIIGLQLGLTDGYCGYNMGDTAELLAKEFRITRKEQDELAMRSQGNSSQITDGAAMLLIMEADKAKAMGYKPLGKIKSFAFAGLDPKRMGLGPVYSTKLALERAGMEIKDIDRIEMNEAFASQIIANLRIFESDSLSKKYLGTDKAIGAIDMDIFNVNGGAIALGHPVGSSASRLILTLLKELQRSKKETGLATLCVGGGQGAAFILEKM